MNHSRSNPHLSLLLAIILIAAQCLLLVHQSDLEEHATGSNCEYCLHASSFGNGHAPAAPMPLPVLAADFIREFPRITGLINWHYSAAQPRAPPTSSVA